MKILRKIPLVSWVVLLSIIAFAVVRENFFSDFTSEQIRLLSSFLTFIGLIFVAVNLQKQWKNERIKTEYLNQPNFQMKGYDSETIINYSPKLCPNPSQCKDDHWFNFKQVGNLAARDLKVGLFTKDEAEENISIKDRWIDEERLGKDDEIQYKLSQFNIPIKFFSPINNMCFVILLDYKSEYSNVRYKRAYKLCAMAYEDQDEVGENDWKGRIYFYDSSLINTSDTESITIKEIIKNYWFSLARKLRIKKDEPYTEWLIDL